MIAMIYDHKAPIFSKTGCQWTTKLVKIVKMALKPHFRAPDPLISEIFLLNFCYILHKKYGMLKTFKMYKM